MGTPSPFETARMVGAKAWEGVRESRDQGVIDQVLNNAIQSGDPRQIEDSMAKILSKVSPERQGAAIQFLQGKIQSIKENQQRGREQKAATDAGY